MKRLLLLCALAIPCFMACEKMDEVESPDVEQQQDPVQSYVMRVAEEGIAMLGDAETRAVRRRIDPNRIKPCITTATRSGESDTLYYVVNFADSAGFALVAADSTSPAPLLAVTEQGNYTPGEVTNTGFDDYISLLADNTGGGNILLPDTLILERDTTSRIVVDTISVDSYTDWVCRGPYVNVRWGQGEMFHYNANYPYNKYCTNPGNVVMYAGCPTVAIAQTMSFYKKPTSYQASWRFNELHTLDWNVILNYPGGHNCTWTDGMRDEIAILFREIVKDANVDFNSNSGISGVENPNDIIVGLERFGYNANALSLYNYATIAYELGNNRIVIVVAGSTSANSGHVWIADGYKSRQKQTNKYAVYSDGREELIQTTITHYNYCHMNWGYDGDNNGYFISGVFDLANGVEYDTNNNDRTDVFSVNVRMITGISYNE